MQLFYAVALGTALAQASAATVVWSPCSLSEPPVTVNIAECATYSAPLCHPGICDASSSGNRTVDIFVKRIRAKSGDSEKAPNVWLLQGGPRYSKGSLDTPLTVLYQQLGAKFNLYTMDHRGTGHSTHVGCPKADSSAGPTRPLQLNMADVAACVQEVDDKYGDLAAFSTTSAATDLVNFIADNGNDFSTIVYGVGYGTVWVERIMHLDPPEVTGYALDGVATTSGASPDKFLNVSSSDTDYGEIGDAFLDLCDEDRECSARFKKKTLKASVEHVMTAFDITPTSTCAKLMKTVKVGEDDDPPSVSLRYLLGWLLSGSGTRTLIPPTVYRLLRCSPKDVEVLTYFIGQVNTIFDPTQVDTVSSRTLDFLVTFSEMWEAPAQSQSTLRDQFTDATITAGAAYVQAPMFCAFSNENSTSCDKVKLDGYDGNNILYERDEYWNRAAKIPEQASVLLMSSELDPVTPPKYAKALLGALDGDKKELVTFKYSTGIDGNLVDSNTADILCGMWVLTSFVVGAGDLRKLNKTCVEGEMAMNWTVPSDFQYRFMSSADVYDGELDETLAKDMAEQSAQLIDAWNTKYNKVSSAGSGVDLTEFAKTWEANDSDSTSGDALSNEFEKLKRFREGSMTFEEVMEIMSPSSSDANTSSGESGFDLTEIAKTWVANSNSGDA